MKTRGSTDSRPTPLRGSGENSTTESLSDERLTDALISRILKWRVAPGRFIKPGRSWIPRWRFMPAVNLNDAFQLLDAAKPEAYSMGLEKGQAFRVWVQIAGASGEAHDSSKARAITRAIGRALGMEVGR